MGDRICGTARPMPGQLIDERPFRLIGPGISGRIRPDEGVDKYTYLPEVGTAKCAKPRRCTGSLAGGRQYIADTLPLHPLWRMALTYPLCLREFLSVTES